MWLASLPRACLRASPGWAALPTAWGKVPITEPTPQPGRAPACGCGCRWTGPGREERCGAGGRGCGAFPKPQRARQRACPRPSPRRLPPLQPAEGLGGRRRARAPGAWAPGRDLASGPGQPAPWRANRSHLRSGPQNVACRPLGPLGPCQGACEIRTISIVILRQYLLSSLASSQKCMIQLSRGCTCENDISQMSSGMGIHVFLCF